MLATCSAKHSPLDFITVPISYEEYDCELACSGWRKLTKLSAFAHFVIWNMNLITLLPTFVSLAQSSMLEYYPLCLCHVWYILMSFQTDTRWSDVIALFLLCKSCCPVVLILELECPMLFWESIFSSLKCLQNILNNPIELWPDVTDSSKLEVCFVWLVTSFTVLFVVCVCVCVAVAVLICMCSYGELLNLRIKEVHVWVSHFSS
jgi:hypothetical protein